MLQPCLAQPPSAHPTPSTCPPCSGNVNFAPGACERLDPYLSARLVGQDLALRQAADAICDHLAQPEPQRPLVLSLHGPPGVGKSMFHGLAATALYNKQPAPGLRCPGLDCAGYKARRCCCCGPGNATGRPVFPPASLPDNQIPSLLSYPTGPLRNGLYFGGAGGAARRAAVSAHRAPAPGARVACVPLLAAGQRDGACRCRGCGRAAAGLAQEAAQLHASPLIPSSSTDAFLLSSSSFSCAHSARD